MWVSRREYQGLLDRIAVAEARATKAEESLELERHENRLAERHWSNQLLRAKQSFPLAEAKSTPPPPPRTIRPVIDPGELAALEAEAVRRGIDPREAEKVLLAEQGFN